MPEPIPSRDALATAVGARYASLASVPGTLSCGRALDHAAPAEGEALVDLGCGRGRDVARAAALVGPRGTAIGVDASDAMLEVARRDARAAGVANASFVRSDLAAIDLPSTSADVVVSNCAVNHAADKVAVYREVHRLLRPGGRFVVSDVVSEEAMPESVRSDPAAWAACYGGAIPEQEYLAAIGAAGFQRIEVLARTAPYEKGGVRVRSITVRGTR